MYNATWKFPSYFTAPFSSMASTTREIADATMSRTETTSNLFPEPMSSNGSESESPISKLLFLLS